MIFSNFLYVLFLFLIYFISHTNCKEEIFSGVYTPDLKISTFDFSASCLISVDQLINSKESLKKSFGMAGATFAIVRNKFWNSLPIVTRDVLDFFVEHLSSYTNFIHKNKIVLFDSINLSMSKSIQLYKSNMNSFIEIKNKKRLIDKRNSETLGILVYSSASFSAQNLFHQSKLRYNFFYLTFLSIYRYFDDILIFVGNEEDKNHIISMDLPYKELIQLDVIPVANNKNNNTITLPKDSLGYIIDKLEAKDENFLKYKYVYYSEGDQILHLRNENYLFDLIDQSFNQFIAIPHRVQTMLLAQNFDDYYKSFFPDPPSSINIPDVNIVEEDAFTPRGSCCEDGYYKTEKCKGWWYQCPEWGVRDINPWFKFGSYGFTAPATTEHALKCNYSHERKVCNSPPFSGCQDINIYATNDNNYDTEKTVLLPKKVNARYYNNSLAVSMIKKGRTETIEYENSLRYNNENNKIIFFHHDNDDTNSEIINTQYYSNDLVCTMNKTPTHLGPSKKLLIASNRNHFRKKKKLDKNIKELS